MFKKIILILLTLSLTVFMSCEDDIIPAAVAAGEDVAAEVADIVMQMGVQIEPSMDEMPSGVGLSRATVPNLSLDDIPVVPTGLTFNGSYIYDLNESESGYDISLTLNLTFDGVQTDDEVWSLNGDLVSALEMEMIMSPSDISMSGTVKGSITASDGSNSSPFDLDLTLVVEQTTEKDFSCTVGGTVTSDSNEITVNETFTYTVESA